MAVKYVDTDRARADWRTRDPGLEFGRKRNVNKDLAVIRGRESIVKFIDTMIGAARFRSPRKL